MEKRKKPDDKLLELFFSDRLLDEIEKIGFRNGVKKGEDFKEIGHQVGRVLLGKLHPKMFQQVLKDEVRLTPKVAEKIDRDFHREIFYPVKEELAKLYEEEISQVESIRSDGFVRSSLRKTASEWIDLADEAKDAEKAVEYYSNALEINPQDDITWYNKGTALDSLGRYEEAVKCYDKSLEINPDDTDAWNSKGLAFDNLERYEETIRCHDKALEINPEDTGALNNKGVALLKLGRYEEAVKCYDKALEIRPNDVDLWYNKGLPLTELERYEEAIKCYDKALEIDPSYELAKKKKKLTERKFAIPGKSCATPSSQKTYDSESLLHWSIAAIWFVSMVILGSTEIIDAFIGTILLWSWVGYLIIFSPWCRNIFLGTLRCSLRFFSELARTGVEAAWCEITQQTRHEAFPKKYPKNGEIYKAYTVDSPHDADMMVIAEDSPYNADIKVYLVDTLYDAQIKIYIVDSYSEADKKVYITDSLYG